LTAVARIPGMWGLLWLLFSADPQVVNAWASVISAVAAFLTLIVISIAAAVAWKQVQEAKSSRHAALMADMSKRWDEEPLAESRRQMNAFSPDQLRTRVAYLATTNDKELDVLIRSPNFFEDLAVLHDAGAITFEMIRKSLGGTLVSQWDHWYPAIDHLRGDQKYDLVYENFEALAERMRNELAKHDVPGE
jgi:hypothetical protein